MYLVIKLLVISDFHALFSKVQCIWATVSYINVHAILGARAEKSERGRRTGGQADEGVRYAHVWIGTVAKLSFHMLISFYCLIRSSHLDGPVAYSRGLSHLHPYGILFAFI